MFHTLEMDRFYTAAPLFDELTRYHLFCAGVVQGKYSGQIWVDDPEQPRTALLVKDGFWAYLGGDPANAAFNEALRAGFFNRQIMGAKSGGLLVSVTSDGWSETLARLFPDRPPTALPRRHYVARLGAFKEAAAPDGFTLHFIDETLPTVSLPGDVQKVLELRAGAAQPDETAFGYVALYNNQYAAHAVIDCIVDGGGDIGLFTAEAFRRRGLAAATSAATIAYGLAHGLTVIHWDSAAYNAGSIHTAEKLGLQFESEHTQYVLVLNEQGHWINQVWNHLDAGQFQTALDVCGRLIASRTDVPAAIHFLAGAAWAGLGKLNQALTSLNTAAGAGWDDVAEMESCEPLAALHGTPEWKTLLAHVRANAESPQQQAVG